MPRSRTADWSRFDNPDASFFFSRQPGKHVTVVTIQPGSPWSSDLHWHETHTEYLHVKRGTALVTLEGRQLSLTAEAGPLTVPRGAVHEWRRDPGDDAELEVWEWTDPSDGEKELFFRNLFSSLRDVSRDPSSVHSVGLCSALLPRGWTLWLQLAVIFVAFDNYPVVTSAGSVKMASRLVVVVAALLGRLLGLKASHPEYLPEDRGI